MVGLSQKEFAEEVGISQGALSQLEAGRSRISLDTLQKMSLCFKANCNWLVNGKGDIFLKEATRNKVKVRSSVLRMDMKDMSLIPLIKEEAHAGYINGHKDKDYISTLDVYKIPGFDNGNYRLFEVSGDSMMPTIHPREIVVAEFAGEWEDIENGTMCIIIAEDGIVAKRAYFYEEDRSMLILKSDNSSYKTYSLPLDDIMEIWLIRARITNIFGGDSKINVERLESLESDIRMLKAQMRDISNSTKSNGSG